MPSPRGGPGGAAGPIVVWFRRDLRLDDQPALRTAIDSGRPVVPLVVLDPVLVSDAASPRVVRYLQAVAALDRDLRAIGGHLVIRRGDPTIEVPRLVAEAGATRVLVSRDVTTLATARDARVGSEVPLEAMPGLVVVEPEATGPVRVFTAFHRRWSAAVAPPPLDAPTRITIPAGLRGDPAPITGLAPDGGPESLARLQAFLASGLAAYDRDRNRLDRPGTSGLSTDLHRGTVSARRLVDAVARAAAAGRVPDAAADSFLRQLAWRDWAHHLLWFKAGSWRAPAPGEPTWRDDARAVAAWGDGLTGFPAVDAAMRQLRATGWIHNRARMIVASFLTKDLLVDWRSGADAFLAWLVDGDVANNTLGWRWTAGMGPDAAPFVRVFNPVIQGRRFDPDGTWVRTWVPELRDVRADRIHRPWTGPERPPRGYPGPIVDHAEARSRALAAFRARARHPSVGASTMRRA